MRIPRLAALSILIALGLGLGAAAVATTSSGGSAQQVPVHHEPTVPPQARPFFAPPTNLTPAAPAARHPGRELTPVARCGIPSRSPRVRRSLT